MISKSGRVYVVYNQYQGIHDYHHQVTGTMDCVYCDDFGRTWSKPSDDDGETWRAPRPLLRKDHGKPILQPIFCCPIYQMSDGRYLLVHYPEFNGIDPGNSGGPKSNRRPAYIAVGEFRPGPSSRSGSANRGY